MSNGILIKRHEPNSCGRDFVVGDLHGCRAALDQALAIVGFDPEADRLFAVGDLGDRGPDSAGCFALLDEPFFYPVRGNHDQMIVDLFAAHDAGNEGAKVNAVRQLIANGARNWLMDSFLTGDGVPECIRVRAERFRALPHLRVIGEGAQRFHVVHAELLGERNAHMEPMSDVDIDSGRFLEAADPEVLVWGRQIEAAAESATALPDYAEGLSLTYCGHTIGEETRLRLSHYNIDTGAFLPHVIGREGMLTLVEHGSGRITQVASAQALA